MLVGPLESYITRAIHGEKGDPSEHQIIDLERNFGGEYQESETFFIEIKYP
jgi:hypothetical protein